MCWTVDIFYLHVSLLVHFPAHVFDLLHVLFFVIGKLTEVLFTELPETSFTRSISNPEAVMRRRRAQKLEKKLQQFRSKDGGPDTGGTLKVSLLQRVYVEVVEHHFRW